MYCKNCGNQINESSKFCPNCGMQTQESNINHSQVRTIKQKAKMPKKQKICFIGAVISVIFTIGTVTPLLFFVSFYGLFCPNGNGSSTIDGNTCNSFFNSLTIPVIITFVLSIIFFIIFITSYFSFKNSRIKP